MSSTALPFRRAVVTGAAGFIGSNLVDRLVAAGVEVVEGRVGQVEMPIRSAQAWESLAGAGYAAVSAEVDPWREAATAVGGTVLVCLGVHERLEAPERPNRSGAERNPAHQA